MARSCSCNDFTRSQLLRSGFAQAGRGLPSIEPGMPLPAGTGLNRRSFMLRSAGAMLSVYGAAALSPRRLEEGIAQAAAAAPPRSPVLVSIFMEGGWDALSVLAPVGEAAYHELRPSLGLQEGEGTPFSEDETLMWHPQAGGLAQLHAEGKVSVFPAIGYEPARREPLHEPPLLGGGRTQRSDPLGLDGPLPRRRRRNRQPAAGPLARLLARARARHRTRARGGGLLAVGLRLLGVRARRTADRARARRVRPARRLPVLLARARPGARRLAGHRASSARRSRRSPSTKANRRSPRPSPTRPRGAISRSGSRCSPRCSPTKNSRSNAWR